MKEGWKVIDGEEQRGGEKCEKPLRKIGREGT